MTNSNDNLIWADGRQPAPHDAEGDPRASVMPMMAIGAVAGLAAPLIVWAGIGSRSFDALLLLPVPLILLLRWLHGAGTVRPAVAGLVAWLVVLPPLYICTFFGVMLAAIGWVGVVMGVAAMGLLGGICAAIAAAGVDLRRVPLAMLAGAAAVMIAGLAGFVVHALAGTALHAGFLTWCVLGPVLWTAALAAVLAAGRPLPTRTTP
jgi:hypothetical protein